MNLLDPIESLKGIGPKTAEILHKSGLKTVRDFFYNIPRDYENYQAPAKISEIKPGKITIKGKIDNLTTRHARRRNFTITEGIITDGSDAIRAVWFNQPYRAKQLQKGKEYYFSGLYDLKNGRFQLTSPSVSLATEVDSINAINSVYVAHSSLKSNDFRRLVDKSRAEFANIPDLLPMDTPNTPNFVTKNARKNALFNVHFPNSEAATTTARKYLAYEELFELILAAKLNKRATEKLKANSIPFDANLIKEFVAKLPYKLTNAQRLATFEILKNLEKSTPMNRLLQGDVGSGKTLVAAIAAYAAAKNGFQTAILAPTAILATQHYESFVKLLEPFDIKVALLTGATKNKSAIKSAIKKGEIDVIIGTHALLTDDTEFNNLSLVIIDEQHRFGVEQREKLLLKSPKNLAPHFLAMTATPIPRSLQLTIFGDLDVSILDELPKGRQPIETKIIPEILEREQVYPKIRELINKGQQIYWICPAVGEDDNVFFVSMDQNPHEDFAASAPHNDGRKRDGEQKTHSSSSVSSERLPKNDISSVKDRARKLQKIFSDLNITYLHGKMKPAEKDAIMTDFLNNKIQILVSTTVVEVGVNVPNANLIIIENAEHYGLAQLHQLRGRVGRGTEKAYCMLLTAEDKAPSRRLKELEKSTDGFHLAEVDLKLRGPGEIYGNLQHGALDLRIATLADTKLIAAATKHVNSFLQSGENMLKYPELQDIIKKYQQLTTLN